MTKCPPGLSAIEAPATSPSVHEYGVMCVMLDAYTAEKVPACSWTCFGLTHMAPQSPPTSPSRALGCESGTRGARLCRAESGTGGRGKGARGVGAGVARSGYKSTMQTAVLRRRGLWLCRRWRGHCSHAFARSRWSWRQRAHTCADNPRGYIFNCSRLRVV